MFQKGVALLKQWWPLGLLTLPFAAVYGLLLSLFPDSIEAFVKMRSYRNLSVWGGVEMLFVLNSAVLGWVSVVVSESRTTATGSAPRIMAMLCCFVAIGGGFASASWYNRNLSDSMWEMLAYSLLVAIGASTLRAYLSKLL